MTTLLSKVAVKAVIKIYVNIPEFEEIMYYFEINFWLRGGYKKSLKKILAKGLLIIFFWVREKSSNNACCSGWSSRQCQTSTD